MKKSFETDDVAVVTNVCNEYGSNIQSDEFVEMGIELCRNKFGKQWSHFKGLGVSSVQIQSFCDEENVGGFGQIYDLART